MTLIDHFNAFQVFCEIKGLTANARSLYYAILAEFNKRRFPQELHLNNYYLQQVSGISARSSFDAARNALISANIISHKRCKYSLIEPVKIENDGGYIWEYPKKTNEIKTVATTENVPPEPIPAEDNSAVSNTDDWQVYARKFISPEVLEAWSKSKGEALEGYKIQDFSFMEKLHGTEKIVAVIKNASLDCNYDDFHKLTYKFFKMKLENPQSLNQHPRGNSKNAYDTRNTVTSGNVRPAEDWEARLANYFTN